jgi:hypothetical protein
MLAGLSPTDRARLSDLLAMLAVLLERAGQPRR